MEMLFTNMTGILAVIGALAFIVSVITQVFKGVGVLAKIHLKKVFISFWMITSFAACGQT